ncbi:hypothetical protein EAI_01595 [Harpegnathos saltator]|uniref:Uncharacterized protein n=1 Tax=Harpegnathos saltator TaxID=610380 RepID=E2B4W6_HARSA|nr:hypothetical protein EAI_01595 [Harpegnathos saltator]
MANPTRQVCLVGAPPEGRARHLSKGLHQNPQGRGVDEGMSAQFPRFPTPVRLVAVAVKVGARTSYAEAFKRARDEIPFGELGIPSVDVGRTADGAFLVRVKDPGNKGEKADKLVEKLRAFLPEAAMRRPEMKGEVRLIRFDESVFPEELRTALAGPHPGAPHRSSHPAPGVLFPLPESHFRNLAQRVPLRHDSTGTATAADTNFIAAAYPVHKPWSPVPARAPQDLSGRRGNCFPPFNLLTKPFKVPLSHLTDPIILILSNSS